MSIQAATDPTLQATPPSSFSYVAAAKNLRHANVPVPDKLRTCHQLLSFRSHLTPHPAPLLFNHIIHVLHDKTHTFAAHRPDYWLLLHQTLQFTPLHLVPTIPSTLLTTAAHHLETPSAALVAALRPAVLDLLSTRHLTTLPIHAALLRAVAQALPAHSSLHPLASRLVLDFAPLLSATSPAEALKIALPVLPSILADDLLRLRASLLHNALFAKRALDKIPSESVKAELINRPDPRLVHFLLDACARVDAARISTVNGRMNTSRLLMFFYDLLTSISSALAKSNGDGLVLASKSVSSLLDTAARLSFYRPSPDDLIAVPPQKKARVKTTDDEIISDDDDRDSVDIQDGDELFAVPEKQPNSNVKTEGVISSASIEREIATTLCDVFVKLTQLLTDQLASRHPDPASTVALTNAAASVISFSIDTIDSHVCHLLAALPSRTSTETSREAQTTLLKALLRAYARMRDVPRFFTNLVKAPTGTTPPLAALGPFLRHPSVAHELAATISDLPANTSVTCVNALGCFDHSRPTSEEASSLAFILALILESNIDVNKKPIVQVALRVVPSLSGVSYDSHAKTSYMFLLSSALFALLRCEDGVGSNTIAPILQSHVVSASGIIVEGGDNVIIGRLSVMKDNDALDSEGDLVDKFTQKLQMVGKDSDSNISPAERFALIRLLCVLVRFYLQKQDIEESDLQRQIVADTLESIFKLYYVLSRSRSVSACKQTSDESNVNDIWAWQRGFAKEASFKVVSSLSDVFDFGLSDQKASSGLIAFLSDSIIQYESDALIWEELLERQSVRTALGKAIVKHLKKLPSTKQCTGVNCGMVRVLRLVRVLPRDYLNDKVELEVKKGIQKILPTTPCCERSIEEAANAILQLDPGKATVNDIISTAVRRGQWHEVLLTLVSSQHERGVSADERLESIRSLLEAGSERWNHLSSVALFWENAALVCERSVSNWDNEHGFILQFLKAKLEQTCRICSSGLDTEKATEDVLASLRALGAALRCIGHASSRSQKEEQAIDRQSKKLLKNLIDPALGSSMRIIHGCGDSSLDAFGTANSFISALCEGITPRYRSILNKQESSVLLSKLIATSLNWLRSYDEKHRTAGVLLLSRLVSHESEECVQDIGDIVLSWIDNVDVDFPQVCEDIADKDRKRIVTVCDEIRGRVLAGCSILCGAASQSEARPVRTDETSGMFKEFTPARKRRDLSGIRLGRNLSGSVVCGVVRLSITLMEQLDQSEKLAGYERMSLMKELKIVEQTAWECATLNINACETAMQRRASHRMETQDAQEILCGMSRILEIAPQRRGDVYEDAERKFVDSVTHCVTAGVQQHRAACRWGAAQLCGTVMTRAGSLGGKTAGMGVARLLDAVGRFCRGGGDGGMTTKGRLTVEVGVAVLAEIAQRFVNVGQCREFRRIVGEAAARVLRTVGEGRARGVLAVATDEAKEVLRYVREVYVERVQYRGM